MLDERGEQRADPFRDTALSLSPGSHHSLDDRFSGDDNVKVMARCRPMSTSEKKMGFPECVKFQDGVNHNTITHIGERKDVQDGTQVP